MSSADRPSDGWLQDVFESEERRRPSKATTSIDVYNGSVGRETCADGGHEQCAMLLLEHLRSIGTIRRWKAQPFNCCELGGPDATPDILAEGRSNELHVIEVKAHRHLTQDVLNGFELERTFLNQRGFAFHIWTDRDRLGPQTSHTVRLVDRGRRSPAPRAIVSDIALAARDCETLGPLFDQFGFDDVLSAIAQLAIRVNVTRLIDEKTFILRDPPPHYYDHLFARGNADGIWWDSLHLAKS